MRYLFELKQQIESTREELDVAAQKEIGGAECYQLSIRLDKLIADYIQFKEDKVQLQNCS